MIELIFLVTFITINFQTDTPEVMPLEIPVLTKDTGQYIAYIYINQSEPRVSDLHTIQLNVKTPTLANAPDQLQLRFQDFPDKIWTYQYRLYSSNEMVFFQEIGIINIKSTSEPEGNILEPFGLAFFLGVIGIISVIIIVLRYRERRENARK